MLSANCSRPEANATPECAAVFKPLRRLPALPLPTVANIDSSAEDLMPSTSESKTPNESHGREQKDGSPSSWSQTPSNHSNDSEERERRESAVMDTEISLTVTIHTGNVPAERLEEGEANGALAVAIGAAAAHVAEATVEVPSVAAAAPAAEAVAGAGDNRGTTWLALFIVLVDLVGPGLLFLFVSWITEKAIPYFIALVLNKVMLIPVMWLAVTGEIIAPSISHFLALRSEPVAYFAAMIILVVACGNSALVGIGAILCALSSDCSSGPVWTTVLSVASPILCALILFFPLRAARAIDLLWRGFTVTFHNVCHFTPVIAGVVTGWIANIGNLAYLGAGSCGFIFWPPAIGLGACGFFLFFFVVLGRVKAADPSTRFALEYLGLSYHMFGLIVSNAAVNDAFTYRFPTGGC